MAVLVVQQGASVAIRTSTMLANMALLLPLTRVSTLLVLLLRNAVAHLVKLWVHFRKVLNLHLRVQF